MSGGMLPPVFVEPTNPTPSVPSLPPPPNPPYSELPPGSSTIPPIQPPGKGSGNYNGGNHDGGSTTSKTPNVDKIYNNSSTLTQEQKKILEETLVKMRKLKAYDLLLDALEAKNIKIKFQIDPSISASANFDCKYNSISFVATNAISVSLPEELVHALQYNVLYGEAMAKGNTDYRFTMEWEANIFVDAARILQENYYYKTGYNTLTNASIELREGHKALMTSILETGYFSQTKHYEKFVELSKSWTKHPGKYISGFLPKALINYLKK